MIKLIHRYHLRLTGRIREYEAENFECSLGGNLNVSSCGVWMVIWPHQAQLWILTSASWDACKKQSWDTCFYAKTCENQELDLKTILVYMLPWSTLRGLSFSPIWWKDTSLQIAINWGKLLWLGGRKRLMPRSLSALFQRAVLAHEQGSTLEHQIVAQGNYCTPWSTYEA